MSKDQKRIWGEGYSGVLTIRYFSYLLTLNSKVQWKDPEKEDTGVGTGEKTVGPVPEVGSRGFLGVRVPSDLDETVDRHGCRTNLWNPETRTGDRLGADDGSGRHWDKGPEGLMWFGIVPPRALGGT